MCSEKLQKCAVEFAMSVCMSVCISCNSLRTVGTDFYEILYW